MGEDSLISHVNCDDDSSTFSDDEKPTSIYSVYVHDLCLSQKKEKKPRSDY